MSITIDNRPITRIAGARPARLSGHLTAPRGKPALAFAPGRLAPFLGDREAVAARFASMGIRLPCATLADRPGVVATLEAALANGIRSIRTADRPGVVTRAIVWDIVPSEIQGAPGMTIPSIVCDVTWLLVDGGSEEWPAPAPILLGTTPTAIPLGSLPSQGTLLAFGYTSPLVVTYTPANGLAPTTWTITQTLATGEHVAAELETGDVWLATAAGGRAKVAGVTGTIPALDPAHALGSVMPRLTFSSGTGLLLAPRRYRL